jgi:arginyl-tRNA synthetase
MDSLHAKIAKVADAAILKATGTSAPAMVRAAQDEKFGDYQLNGVLPLAKQTKTPPRDLALRVVEHLDRTMFSNVEVAGPGFINVTLEPAFLEAHLHEMAADPHGGVPQAQVAEKIVVDFSSPNIAKQMHIGHIRSTILGSALVKILRAVGHEVIGDNHLGDWGTQFGLLIAGMRVFGSEAALATSPIEELERIYKLATAKAKDDAAFAEEARSELAKLQTGEAENTALWKKFVETTRVSLERVYARLGISFDLWMGESAYNEMLPGVLAQLRNIGVVRESEGAQCVFFAEVENAPPELKAFKEPFILQKRDGAFLYSTTDVATLQYRKDSLGAQRSLYVVDSRQSHHFRQIFALASMLGIPTTLAHVGFGSILGPDNKPLKTRDGQAIMLEAVLDEAVERARARIVEEGLQVPEAELAEVARKVGIGAVKYADLRQNRMSDYVFDWDKLISFKGNAGPTVQYAGARIYSIFEKAQVPFAAQVAPPAMRDLTPQERALGKQLARFGETVEAASSTYEPHLLTDYAFELTRRFSAFYEACPILRAESEQIRATRLQLAWLTGATIARTLALLGIETVAKM